MYILLFLFWVILNGRITLEITIFGLVLSAAIYFWMCKFANYSFQKDMTIIRKLPLILMYCVVLLIEIIKANIVMMQYVMSPTIMNEPALVRFHVDFKHRTAQVLLANSITLTPGTITVEMENGDYLVHCYDKSMGDGIDESVFVQLLKKLEA